MDHSFTCSQILEGPSLLGLVHYYSNFWQSPLYEVMEGHWTDVWPGCPGPSNRAREVVHSDSGATRGRIHATLVQSESTLSEGIMECL